MQQKFIPAGALNRRVEAFRYTDTSNAQAEAVKSAVSLGYVRVNRRDVAQSEDEYGRLVALSVCRFVMRYREDFLQNGTKYFIRDLDGDYEVTSVTVLPTRQRNKFLELKTSKIG